VGEDMKKICLYYFSGTGMTKYVMDCLADEIKKHNISVDSHRIEEAMGQPIDLSDYCGLMIAYPTHSLNPPKIVADFVKKLPRSSGMNVFIVYTCSADAPVNYACSNLLIKRLSRKGYKVSYDKLVEMPSNFAHRYTDKQATQALVAANSTTALIANDIAASKTHFMQPGFGTKVLSFLARIEWIGAPIIGKFFYVKKDCVHCLKCVKNCPEKNIAIKRERIGFKFSCGICMRCVYQCEKNAIHIRWPFKFIRFDKWYDRGIFKRD